MAALPQRGSGIQPRVARTRYPGNTVVRFINPNGVAASATTLSGMKPNLRTRPRVGAARQPRAGRHNPVGIELRREARCNSSAAAGKNQDANGQIETANGCQGLTEGSTALTFGFTTLIAGCNAITLGRKSPINGCNLLTQGCKVLIKGCACPILGSEPLTKGCTPVNLGCNTLTYDRKACVAKLSQISP